jgi:DHA1 family multidrug resistance protein-like MFS transporter
MLRVSGGQRPLLASWSLTFALLGDSFLYVFLPLHAASVHVPAVWVGVLLSINRFVRIGLTPWMGVLFHRYGFRPLSIGAAALAIVSTAGYGLSWGIGGWLLLRIAWGLAFSVLRLSSLRYALEHPQPGFSLGVSRSILELGPMAALVAGPWLLLHGHAAWAFGVLTLGSVPALWFAYQLPERQDGPLLAPGPRLRAPSLVNGLTCLSAFAVEGLVVVAAGVLLLQAYPLASAGMATAWVAGYLLFRRVCAIVLSPAGGWLADRYGLAKVYAASLGLIGAGLLLLAAGQAAAGLLVLFTFSSVNASLAVGGALAGKAPTTQAVAGNVAWRDAGAAIGALVGGMLLTSGWLPLVLSASGVALLGLVARYVSVSLQPSKNRLLWK